jgi:hypothetical protein
MMGALLAFMLGSTLGSVLGQFVRWVPYGTPIHSGRPGLTAQALAVNQPISATIPRIAITLISSMISIAGITISLMMRTALQQ